MASPHRLLLLLYPQYEALDLWGPLGLLLPHHDKEYVITGVVSLSPEPLSTVESNAGSIPLFAGKPEAIGDFLTRASSSKTSLFDTLIVPGGTANRPLLNDEKMLAALGSLIDLSPRVFTICTGSVLVAATGRLDGIKATTNKKAYHVATPDCAFIRRELEARTTCSLNLTLVRMTTDPKVEWQPRARWVLDNRFLTSSGVTAGMDAALRFMELTWVANGSKDQAPMWRAHQNGIPWPVSSDFDPAAAEKAAKQTADGLEYRWHRDPADDPFAAE